MHNLRFLGSGIAATVLALCALPAFAQSFRVQCPPSTPSHHGATGESGGIKCQQISGGDGYATMGDGTQTYLFGFGPLSGLDLISRGLPGTQSAANFNNAYNMPNYPCVNANSANAAVPDLTYRADLGPHPDGRVFHP